MAEFGVLFLFQVVCDGMVRSTNKYINYKAIVLRCKAIICCHWKSQVCFMCVCVCVFSEVFRYCLLHEDYCQCYLGRVMFVFLHTLPLLCPLRLENKIYRQFSFIENEDVFKAIYFSLFVLLWVLKKWKILSELCLWE